MTQRRTARQGAKSPATEGIATDLPFEEAYVQMQQVISQLENGDLPLDAAVSAFERGMRLAQHCTTLLDKAELRVQTIEEQTDGSLRLRDIIVETE